VTEPVDEATALSLPDLVAYQRIRALEAQLDAYGENETLVAEATQLALDHGFVTERTSLDVDLPEQREPRAEPDQPQGMVQDAESADHADGSSQQPTSRSTHDGEDGMQETGQQATPRYLDGSPRSPQRRSRWSSAGPRGNPNTPPPRGSPSRGPLSPSREPPWGGTRRGVLHVARGRARRRQNARIVVGGGKWMGEVRPGRCREWGRA
jgi:hypothetical protein